MMELRTWLPSHDAYHGAFRMLRLSRACNKEIIPLEKLYILDFYLAYPSLLHKSHMPQNIRSSFSKLNIVKPEKEFLSLPNSISLFRDMAVIQIEAVKLLVGKSIFDKQKFLAQEAQLLENNIPPELNKKVTEKNLKDQRFTDFLVNEFGNIHLENMRKSTSLKRRSL